MKIVFFGSGRFAVSALDALHQSGHDICLVVTQPDRRRGRHLHLATTPVKDCALSCQLNIFQPQDINTTEALNVLKEIEADIFVVVSYGKILSREILDLPKKFCINIHASLLPKYRGAAPINWALIHGESETGVTFIRMNEYMDQGDIIFQKAIKIESDDHALILEEKLSRFASNHIHEVLENVKNSRIQFIKQDEAKASQAPLLKKQDGLIQWSTPCEQIYNCFRGCFGWPGSFTYYHGRIIKILDMNIGSLRSHGKPGEIIKAQDNILEVSCRLGSIVITQVLPESHNKMSVSSFLTGHNVQVGDLFKS